MTGKGTEEVGSLRCDLVSLPPPWPPHAHRSAQGSLQKGVRDNSDNRWFKG